MTISDEVLIDGSMYSLSAERLNRALAFLPGHWKYMVHPGLINCTAGNRVGMALLAIDPFGPDYAVINLAHGYVAMFEYDYEMGGEPFYYEAHWNKELERWERDTCAAGDCEDDADWHQSYWDPRLSPVSKKVWLLVTKDGTDV